MSHTQCVLDVCWVNSSSATPWCQATVAAGLHATWRMREAGRHNRVLTEVGCRGFHCNRAPAWSGHRHQAATLLCLGSTTEHGTQVRV